MTHRSSNEQTIHYGPVYGYERGQSMALCRPPHAVLMTTDRSMVDCETCKTMLVPRECSICRGHHGREVIHACE